MPLLTRNNQTQDVEWIPILFAACITKQTQGNMAPHMQVRLSLEPVLRALSKSSQCKHVLISKTPWEPCSVQGRDKVGLAQWFQLPLEPLEEWLWVCVPVIRWERMVENVHPGLSWKAVLTPPNGISGGRTQDKRICKARMGRGSCVLCKHQWCQYW